MSNKTILAIALVLTSALTAMADERPNILLCIADDASMSSFGAYGGTTIETPSIDELAKAGVLFRNAYNCNPKCAPARASLLTGRYSWQLEQATNHSPHFPEKFTFYPRLLKQAGFHTGFTGKGWGPGTYTGENPAGPEYNHRKLQPPFKGMKKIDYAGNFTDFLDQKPEAAPFCFWLGTFEPHRVYELDSWKKTDLKLSDAIVPPFFPDNATIRGDLLDYAVEVKWYDQHVGLAVKELKDRGLLDNTLIVVTSDHGMPFPRIKGQMYDEGFHVPMVVFWKGVIQPGRTIDDFVNFPDLAPTLMQAANQRPHKQMTGKSFLDLLRAKGSGQIDPARDHVLLGKERHDVGRENQDGKDLAYPVRCIRTKEFLYVHNIKPERWPVGNPELGLKNCDKSPTKTFLTDLALDDPQYPFYELSFGLRPAEEFYRIQQDPHCMNNLAEDPKYRSTISDLRNQMQQELIAQGDPRTLGKGDVFDKYPYIKTFSKKKKQARNENFNKPTGVPHD